jgi:hypothetical protein
MLLSLNLLTLNKIGQPLKVEKLFQCGAVEHYSNVVWAPDYLSVYFTDRMNSSMPYQTFHLTVLSCTLLQIKVATGKYEVITS